jgi:signal transduction histidine kinase
MAANHGLKRLIDRTFLLQTAAIVVTALLGVFLAAWILQNVLVAEALRAEGEHFWSRRGADPHFPLPDTANLTGHLGMQDGDAGVPGLLRGLSDGFHDVRINGDEATVYVSSRAGRRLFLVFNGEAVNELAIFFGLVPLGAVLLVLYLSVWLGYQASRRAVSPFAWLAREVNRLDPDEPDASPFADNRLPGEANDELRVLAAALFRFIQRLDAFVERERTFTRDASHELRTPLTVIRMAADLLADNPELPQSARSGIERIRRSVRDMQSLVDALLMLARETEGGTDETRACVNEIVADELERQQLLLAGRPIEVSMVSQCRLSVAAPARMLAMLFGNLLGNAFAYTESGYVRVSVQPGQVTVEDSGVGMDEDAIERAFQPFYRGLASGSDGYGIGLTIVKRVAEKFGWSVCLDSTPGVGTCVTVTFPDGRCLDDSPPSQVR